jgi:hypothetical protein
LAKTVKRLPSTMLRKPTRGSLCQDHSQSVPSLRSYRRDRAQTATQPETRFGRRNLGAAVQQRVDGVDQGFVISHVGRLDGGLDGRLDGGDRQPTEKKRPSQVGQELVRGQRCADQQHASHSILSTVSREVASEIISVGTHPLHIAVNRCKSTISDESTQKSTTSHDK